MTDPCVVDGPGLGKLVPLLSKAFTEIELEELIRFTFSEGLFEAYVPPGLPLRHLVFKLMEALEQRGTTDIFLRAVLTARPRRRDLADLILSLCPSATRPEPEARTQVEFVLRGLTVLQASAAKLKPLVPEFNQLLEHFTRMAKLIQLIDGMTSLQLRLELLDSESRYFTVDPVTSWQESETLLLEAEEASKPLRGAAIELSEELWWIERLLQSLLILREAIQRRDAAGYNVAVSSIRTITDIELSRHTQLLQRTAQDLPLDYLIHLIADVRDYAGYESISAAAINLSLEALQHLFPRVRGLATRQGHWREIERQVSLIVDIRAAPAGESREKLVMLWAKAVSAVDKIVQIDPESAALASIRHQMAKINDLVALVEESDPGPFGAGMALFHRQVQHESYRASRALYVLCRDILQILQPLQSLLAALSRRP